jgi:hypothetical protein
LTGDSPPAENRLVWQKIGLRSLGASHSGIGSKLNCLRKRGVYKIALEGKEFESYASTDTIKKDNQNVSDT